MRHRESTDSDLQAQRGPGSTDRSGSPDPGSGILQEVLCLEPDRVLRYRKRDVHPKHRFGREVLHLSTRSFRACRFQGAPTHLAQPGTTLPDRATGLASALPADRRDPHRSARTGARCPRGWRRMRSASSPNCSHAPAPRRRTRHPTRGCRFARTHPSALARRGAGGVVAMDQLALRARLQELPVPASLGAAVVGSVIARMARPGSDRATRRWLGERSALGELLGVDFETMGAMQLSRASDALMAHREAIERHLFDRAMGLFDLHPTVTLYDLTNTFFEGAASAQGPARALQGQAHRLPASHPGAGARFERLRAPLQGVRRQRRRTPHHGRQARCAGCPARDARGHGPWHRHRGARAVAARQWLSVPGGQP